MTIGEKIKQLRKKNDLTQEKLADYLCVSYQAVSKWECGLSSPDISLIAPLTRLFHVSADELLCLTPEITDERKAYFDAEFHEFWKKEDHEADMEIARQAVAEYPGNMEYVEWLASAEYYVAIPTLDNSEYTRLLESSAKHYKLVLDNTKDSKLYSKALFGIVLALSCNQKKDEAKQYAMLEEDEEKRVLC